MDLKDIKNYTPAMLAPPYGQSGSFSLLLDRVGEKEALPQSCQVFDVTATGTFGLVNLFSLVKLGF